MQAAQLPEPAAVPVQRPASPALAPALRTISGETPHYRARFEVAAADGADAAEAVKEIVMGWLHAKGLDVPEGAADIAVPAGWTAADEPDAAKAVRFLGLSGAQGAAWAVEADELDSEFSRRRWHTRIASRPPETAGASSTCRYRTTPLTAFSDTSATRCRPCRASCAISLRTES